MELLGKINYVTLPPLNGGIRLPITGQAPAGLHVAPLSILSESTKTSMLKFPFYLNMLQIPPPEQIFISFLTIYVGNIKKLTCTMLCKTKGNSVSAYAVSFSIKQHSRSSQTILGSNSYALPLHLWAILFSNAVTKMQLTLWVDVYNFILNQFTLIKYFMKQTSSGFPLN